MSERCLMMIEVSQKQTFIFRNKHLKDNIYASKLIQYITSEKYFKSVAGREFALGSVVYNGGGHTILEFACKEDAQAFSRKVTKNVMEHFPGLEVFIKIYQYNENLSPEENEKKLTGEMEKKKAERKVSFYQRKFGIEAMGNHERELSEIYGIPENDMMERERKPIEKKIQELLGKYTLANRFEKLGGMKNERNFIAVVHIDGNLMGKRVGTLAQSVDSNIMEKTDEGWENYKQVKHKFSQEIDNNFKEAYYEMLQGVAAKIDDGTLLKFLNLEQKDGKYTFPVRDIILAGDDICFVTEGRIGLTCAAAYLESIWKQENKVDKKNYSACAGVAIVHQKYPFYRAYELAEQLCSNAKKMIAGLTEEASANVCAIDWHVEFGEMENGLSEIRKQYRNLEGRHLEMRPYIVCGDSGLIDKERIRRYEHFKEYTIYLQKNEIAARSKMKSLHTVLREEERVAVNYLKSHLLEDMVWQARDCFELQEQNQAEKLYYRTYDKEERNMLFDAIEMMDLYITW